MYLKKKKRRALNIPISTYTIIYPINIFLIWIILNVSYDSIFIIGQQLAFFAYTKYILLKHWIFFLKTNHQPKSTVTITHIRVCVPNNGANRRESAQVPPFWGVQSRRDYFKKLRRPLH